MSSPVSFNDRLRQKFSQAMATMYCREVPDYQKVVDLVQSVNAAHDPSASARDLTALSEERHGAIRIGKAEELSTIRRLFAVLGMAPVGYYDLSVAAIPVHSTAFRPITAEAISACPFRVFTSLLRLDLIDDADLRQSAHDVLAARHIFSDTLLDLLAHYENTDTLSDTDADLFIDHLVTVFQWREEANVSAALYQKFHDAHRLIADVVSFKGPHINHLTPRTLDIDQVQDQMPHVGLNPKAVIEGPPKRAIPLLLRQTAFNALKEDVTFIDMDGSAKRGAHTARFGEIEQRGAALTPKGQALYDQLLNEARQQVIPTGDGKNAAAYYEALEQTFTRFPDDLETLHAEKLIYVTYHLSEHGKDQAYTPTKETLAQAIKDGFVTVQPITYEDFLPVSAAGIFQSNLGDAQGQQFVENANQAAFETALGGPVTDLFKYYEHIQAASLAALLTD